MQSKVTAAGVPSARYQLLYVLGTSQRDCEALALVHGTPCTPKHKNTWERDNGAGHCKITEEALHVVLLGFFLGSDLAPRIDHTMLKCTPQLRN